MEIRSASRTGAEFLASVAAAEEIALQVFDRPGHSVAYAKGTSAIADLLAAAGASASVLELQERAVIGATRSRANRLANADHANLVRTSRAAHEQLEAARVLARDGRLERLPAPVRQAAELRLAHPTASLRELALECDPPATKAALHRRLRKLVALAEA